MNDYRCEMVRSASSGRYRVEVSSLPTDQRILNGPWRKTRERATGAAVMKLQELILQVAALSLAPYVGVR